MTMSLQTSTLSKMKDKSRELAKETEHSLKSKRSYKRKKKGPSISNVCKKCGKAFVCQKKFFLHMQKHNGKNTFECHVCQKNFSRSDHLKNHVARHFKIGKYPCNQCDKIYKRADLLKYHKVNEHGSTISFKELRSYNKDSTQKRNSQCGICGKFFLHEKGLKAHSKIHSMSTKYECNHCGKFFTQRSNLTVHVRLHTGVKPYKCDTCGEAFHTSCKLKTHVRKHTGDLLFVCEVCGKRFGEIHLLKLHLRIHENFRAFVCSYCGKSFTHSSTLRSHIRIHTGAKPYKCDMCKESFAQISSLSYHRKSHLGEKPFVCDICGNMYTRRSTLHAHRVRHTGDKRFLCSHCDFKCDIDRQLRKHILLHHAFYTNGPVTSAHDMPQKVGNMQLDGTQAACGHPKKATAEAVLTKSNVSCELFTPVDSHTDVLSNRYQTNLESSSMQDMATKTLSLSSGGIISRYIFPPYNYGSSNSHSRHIISDPQSLYSDVTLSHQSTMSYAKTSMEGLLKNGESSSFPSDSIVLPMTTPKTSASELLPIQAQTQSNDYHGHEALSLTHPTLPLKRDRDTENIASHPDVHLENGSHLCHSSNSKHHMFPSIAQILASVPEPSSSTFKPLQSKPNSHSLPSFLPQAHASSLDESNCHSMGITELQNKNCDVPSTKENTLVLDSSMKDSQSKLSSKSDANLPKQEMNDKRDCHSGTSMFVNPPLVQYNINFDMRKEFLNESNSSIVNEVNPNTLPLDFSALKKKTTLGLTNKPMLEPGKGQPMNDSLHGISTLQDAITVKKDISTLADSQSMFLVSEDLNSGIVKQKNSELTSLITFSSPSQDSKKFKHALNPISTVKHHKRKQKLPSRKLMPESRDMMKIQGQEECENILSASEDLSQDETKVMTPYKCEICGKTFARRNYWNIHMQLHSGEKSFMCPFCGKEFSRSHHMKDHMLLHSRAKELRCYHCLEEFSNSELLEEHIQRMHNSAYPFKCNVCSFSFLELIELKGHISQAHAEVNFSCQVCGLAFKTAVMLKEHMKEHPGKNAFDCQQCGKPFSQNSCLILHIRKKHSKEKLFACGVCPDAFITASDLQRHLKGHTGDRPFACDQCQKVFTDGKLLRRHQKIHLDERPYQCDHCPKRFKHLNTLYAHIRIHTGSKPYKCDVCGEAFTQSSSLAYHQETHDRTKMYTCDICGKSYTRMATLNLHLLQHSGRSRFQCQECAYKCNKAKAFKRHMEKCHGQEACTE